MFYLYEGFSSLCYNVPRDACLLSYLPDLVLRESMVSVILLWVNLYIAIDGN